MPRTLFLGDSHAHGYYHMGGKIHAWEPNNYAELYSKLHDKKTVIYSVPGGCNHKYPVWIKSMFDRYDDIDEVFVQSTYWNRFLLSCSKELSVGEETDSTLYLCENQPKDEMIDRYTDERIQEHYVEMIEQPRKGNYEKFKGFTFDGAGVTDSWSLFHEKYTYTKVFHELITPLQFKDYCLDMFVIDKMCKDYGVKWYLWSINDRVFVPPKIDFFGKNDAIRAPMSAESFLKERFKMDIETDHYRLDGEHYIKEVHSKIANDYFGYLKGTDLRQDA